MSSRSTVLKNRGSAAKRAATALRGLAGQADFDIADQGVLLSAAKIADSFAHRKEKEAKQAKAEEAKYERDNKVARAVIEPVVRSLPGQTIAEKVALSCLRSHFHDCLVKSVCQHAQREIKWELDYYAQTAVSETISNAAYWVATGKGTALQAIEDIKAKHCAIKADQKIAALAKRFEDALEPAQKVAA